ncbi:MAG: putative Ig domain-containing protein [Oligoflexia bacterium]|nr:putative Ig domain-containing protein [Oligoflexia bacterium]
MSLWARLSHIAFFFSLLTSASASTPPPIFGKVDGISYGSDGGPVITGWVCQHGNSSAIRTNVYLGGAYGSGGTYSSALSVAGLANLPSEAAANSSCTGKAHEFSIPIPASVVEQSSGQSIYVYGLYPVSGQGAVLLSGSGNFDISPPVIGDIQGVTTNSSGAVISGWACYVGNASSLNVSLYVGSGYPTGELVTSAVASGPSDASIVTACGSAGSAYNFSIQLSEQQLTQFSGQGIYIHGISPAGGNNPLLNNSGAFDFPAPASVNSCSVSSLSSLNACIAGGAQVIEFASDVTCTGSSCCNGSSGALIDLENLSYRVIQGNGHTLHRLADPNSGLGYQSRCSAININNAQYIQVNSLNIDDDETVPACTVATNFAFICAQTVAIQSSSDVDFEKFGVYSAKGYAVSATASKAITFNNSVISNAGVIGFYAGGGSEYVFVKNSVISGTGANGIAFQGVTGLYFGANAIQGNIFNANHYRGAWPDGAGQLIDGGQVYLPLVDFVNVTNNIIADSGCTGCANNGEDWGMELGSPQASPSPVVDNMQVSGNYIYNGKGLPFLMNGGAQFGGQCSITGNTVYGFTDVNKWSPSDEPNFATFDTSTNIFGNTPILSSGASLSMSGITTDTTPSLNRGGVSDYSIYRLRITSSGFHEEANTATEQGSSAVLEDIFGLSPRPRLGASSNPIYRCFVSGSTTNDFASLDPNCGGTQRSFHSILGYSYESTYPGASPIYSCKNKSPATDKFVSWSSSCEGMTVVGQLGYAVPYRYLSPINLYTQGEMIELNNPNTWQISGLTYSISPALPAGLSLNKSTGVISGTPTAAASLATYTVTVSGPILNGSSSSSTASIQLKIAVNPALAYSTPSPVYSHGTAITANSPTSASAAVFTQYSVAPALPAGLSLNATTGVISGTPTAASALATYTVVGSGVEGHTSSASLKITVQ